MFQQIDVGVDGRNAMMNMMIPMFKVKSRAARSGRNVQSAEHTVQRWVLGGATHEQGGGVIITTA